MEIKSSHLHLKHGMIHLSSGAEYVFSLWEANIQSGFSHPLPRLQKMSALLILVNPNPPVHNLSKEDYR